MSNSRILYLFTRTPLHVGAGASVGAIDQPIQRERHTGVPVIPASSLKGTFADAWNDGLLDEHDKGETKKVRVKKDGTASDAAWLFGSDSDKHAAAGALQFSEAKLLAFPIRSAKGSFAWITCPLMLRRAVRDRVITADCLPTKIPTDEQALFASTVPYGNQQMPGPLRLDVQENGQPVKRIVLEEYTFTWANDLPVNLGATLATLVAGDPVWQEVANRLVILSDGMMSFFAQNACEVAQHVKISDETGTAEGGALFNQENVPSESLFYSVLHAFDERTANKAKDQRRDGGKAIETFETKLKAVGVFQFGADASTGLGYCTVSLKEPVPAATPPAATTTI
ncbi:MAG: type III-B CRISPR module RAMP protein Cmr4 [Verrucomicrobiota bacterium]